MIHSLSGGVITEYDVLIYVFVQTEEQKRWYISPFNGVKVGDKVLVPANGGAEKEGEVLRVEKVTAQTAPFPVKRTQEIICIIG